MPELPEVEVIVRDLRQKVLAEKVADVRVYWPKAMVADGCPLPLSQEIHRIDRHGKFLILCLDQVYMLIHLRMTGKLIVSSDHKIDRSHLRVLVRFDSGKSLLFYDTRKFGRMYLTRDPRRFLNRWGIDALNPDFSENDFIRMMAGKKGIIKAFLLNQQYLAGLGNIYADECLFRAGIHPQRRIETISRKQLSLLYRSIRKVLRGAIDHMGTTLADYRTPSGSPGRHQNFLKVYDREQQPCFRCKNLIVKIRVGGRGTHFCPACQPLKP